jgi:hypothetical protein
MKLQETIRYLIKGKYSAIEESLIIEGQGYLPPKDRETGWGFLHKTSTKTAKALNHEQASKEHNREYFRDQNRPIFIVGDKNDEEVKTRISFNQLHSFQHKMRLEGITYVGFEEISTKERHAGW